MTQTHVCNIVRLVAAQWEWILNLYAVSHAQRYTFKSELL
jgi:hypothetical protein